MPVPILMERRFGLADFKEVYERCAPLVYRRARMLLGRDADAWDSMQEVFRRVLESESEFRGDSRPMTYLYRITTNVCLNALRARALREPGAEAGSGAAPREPAEEQVPADDPVEARNVLRALVSELDEGSLQIAALYFVDGLTQEEISEVVGLSRKTVGLRLQQLKERAASLVEEPGRKHG